jgi:hypothetical protein
MRHLQLRNEEPMKQVTLNYSSGENQTFITTDANAAAIVERFCNGSQVLIERYYYSDGWFLPYNHMTVSTDIIARVVIDRDDFIEGVPIG